MIRAYNTPGWVMYINFPRTGMLVDVMCMICTKNQTVLVEEYWRRFRKIRFMCQHCKVEIGSANIERKI